MHELEPLRPDAPRLVPEAELPRSRFVPELHPHPRRDPAGSLYGQPERVPGLEATRWREDRSYRLGIDLYHQGYLWESHEAFEACFFASGDPLHRTLLQALIQLAAAELQLHRGVANGVRTLATKVIVRLETVAAAVGEGERFCGLAVGELAVAARARFAGVVEEGGETGDPLRTGGPPVLLETV